MEHLRYIIQSLSESLVFWIVSIKALLAWRDAASYRVTLRGTNMQKPLTAAQNIWIRCLHNMVFMTLIGVCAASACCLYMVKALLAYFNY